jgi:membrane-associated phospholipid phosphatase
LVSYLQSYGSETMLDWRTVVFILSVLLFALVLVIIFSVLVVYLAYRWVSNNWERVVEKRDAILSYPPLARLLARHARLLGWLRRRLTPGEYLGLHLTAGLLVAAGCLWLFGDVSEDVVTNDPLVRFDQVVASVLHNLATPALTSFFLIVTAAGSDEAIVSVSTLVAVVFGVRRQWLPLGTWIAAVAGGAALNLLLKQLFARPRPSFEHPLLLETGYSFPSSHAMESLVIYGMLTYFTVLTLQTWRVRIAIIFGVMLLVLLISFSRMYLGVHYFSDVVAGFAVGGVWLSTCITAVESLRRRSKHQSDN